MRVLLDADVPATLRHRLPGHDVTTAQRMGWSLLENGDLLNAAETDGFDVFVTGDKNLSYQQNLEGRQLAIVLLGTTHWKQLRQDTTPVVAAVNRATPGSFEALPAPSLPARRPPHSVGSRP